MDDRPICERIIPYNNNTAVIPGYEGIPQNLLVNFVAWTILLLLFSLLRKVAWDYGRIALTKPRKNQWTSLFYSEVRPLSNDDDSVEGMDVAYATHDSGACSWVRTYFTLRNSDLEKKAGIDAVQYLRFQLYLIIYTAITMVLCLVVVLPLNMKGNLKSPDLQQFGVTTISNIAGESATLWGHVILGFVFFLLAFLLMQHFSRQLRFEAKQARTTSYQTLMISGISRSHCQRDLLLRHFREAFPACEVDDVQVCYDIRQLVKWDNRWESSKAALNYSKRKLDLTGKRPIMVPRCCGWTCAKLYRAGYCHSCFARKPIRGHLVTDIGSQGSGGGNQVMSDEVVRSGQCICSRCCVCPAPVDAVEYYSKESEYLKNRIEEEGVKAVRTKIGIAFVTFTSVEAADMVHRSYNRYCGCLRGQLKSSVSDILRSHAWTVQFAPTPSNIIWPNLAVTRTVWWMRAIGINAVVFLVVFFLTTPTYVLNLVSKLRLLERLQITNPLIIQFLPSIILWSVSAFLPFLVFNSDRLVGHWTRSGLHLTVMAKTFTLLLLMVLLLPSLGLTSIPALLQWLFPEMRLIPLVPGDKNASTLSPSNNISSTVSTVISTFTAVSSNWTYNESTTAATPITLTTPQIPLGPQSFQWQCVFMPDNGAFFVNYVITSAFIGTAMELVRVPELIVYACRILCVRSQAEKAGVRKASQWEFDFGLYYAWTLCVFAVISAYSILCPLITPFGLVYLIFRYLVERYNLFFAYLPSRIDSRIHCLAMNFMLLAVLLLQLNLFMFVALRRGAIGSALSIASLSGLVISAFFWIMAVVGGWVYVGSAPNKRLGMERFGPVLPMDVTAAHHAHQGDRNQWERMEERQSPEYHVPERSTVEIDGTDRASSHVDQLKLALGPPTEEVIRNPTEVTLNRALSLGTTHALTTPVGEHPLLRAQHRSSLPEYSDTQFIAPILLSFVQEAEYLSETTSINERD